MRKRGRMKEKEEKEVGKRSEARKRKGEEGKE